MLRIRNIIIAFLLLSLVVVEVFPHRSTQPRTTGDSNLVSSLVNQYVNASNRIVNPTQAGNFMSFDLPNLGTLNQDTRTIMDLNNYSSEQVGGDTDPLDIPYAGPAPDLTALLNNVVPPFGTPLYNAYQDGARAWYQKSNNVLVIYPDERIKSFDKKTGAANSWLKLELAYPPVDDASALSNYQNNYRAEVVAETAKWVLMEFPSGGVIKVTKPQYAGNSTSATTTTYGNLPTVLPGYGS
ncbi:MAG: hypothetical protein V1826_02275 [bacterium]